MKTTIIKITFLVLALLTVVFEIRAEDGKSVNITTTPAFKTFLTNYVSAINSKDRAMLTKCLYTKSVTMMAKGKELSDYWFEHRFMYSIPADFNVYANAIPSDKPLPLANAGVVFPVRPTYQVQISYMPTPTNGVNIVLWVVSEDDKWSEVVPSAPKKK